MATVRIFSSIPSVSDPTMVVVANGKSWGIPWGLVEGNRFWNAFLNVRSRSFIKCPTLDAVEDRNNF